MLRACRVVVLVALSFFAGGRVNNTLPASHPQEKIQGIDIVLLSQSMAGLAQLWEPEVARRFPGAVMLVCHGDDRDGEWVMTPDFDLSDGGFQNMPPVTVKEMVLRTQIRYPGRMIVLICCNPGGYDLDLPLVAYAKANVWVIPDRNLLPRVREDGASVGNIFEFAVNTHLP